MTDLHNFSPVIPAIDFEGEKSRAKLRSKSLVGLMGHNCKVIPESYCIVSTWPIVFLPKIPILNMLALVSLEGHAFKRAVGRGQPFLKEYP
jgi:hypothetical protein